MCQNNDLNIKKKKGENLDFENQSRKQCEKKNPNYLNWTVEQKSKIKLTIFEKKINQLSE